MSEGWSVEPLCDVVNCGSYQSGSCALEKRSEIEILDALRCKYQRKVQLDTTFCRVRDYKDRFILRMLQEEARRENPSFVFFDRITESAKIIWLGKGSNKRPVGYYIYTGKCPDISKPLWRNEPPAFLQVFVIKVVRRRGLATKMFKDFVSEHSGRTIMVESPKYETRMLLEKLGYVEEEEDRTSWERYGGLTLWSLRDGNFTP
jgi:hypothetical protein